MKPVFALVLFVSLLFVADAAAQSQRWKLGAPNLNRWDAGRPANLPARPVRPNRPINTWRPWTNYGYYPGNVILAPTYVVPPQRWDATRPAAPTPAPAPPPKPPRQPVQPKAMQWNPATGRFEDVSLQRWSEPAATSGTIDDRRTPTPNTIDDRRSPPTANLNRWDGKGG